VILADVNCVLGHWPFRHLEPSTPEALAAQLESEGIRRALVYSLEAVLSPDLDRCNRELFAACRGSTTLVPVPTIDPSLPSWRRDLEACRGESWPGAVRIVPQYHRYRLADTAADALADILAAANTTLVVQMRVDDERNQYPLMQVPGVPVDDIAALVSRHGDLRILCLCCYLPEAVRIAQAGPNVAVDTSFIEVLDTLRVLLAEVPARQVAFGSYTPMLYTRANVMKVSFAEVAIEQREQVAWRTATRLSPAFAELASR
jgi:predicted TIM-barrel fold metal-dependent hydrolase